MWRAFMEQSSGHWRPIFLGGQTFGFRFLFEAKTEGLAPVLYS